MLIDTNDVIMKHVETLLDPTTGHTFVRGLITSKTDPSIGLRWSADLGIILQSDQYVTPTSFGRIQ